MRFLCGVALFQELMQARISSSPMAQCSSDGTYPILPCTSAGIPDLWLCISTYCVVSLIKENWREQGYKVPSEQIMLNSVQITTCTCLSNFCVSAQSVLQTGNPTEQGSTAQPTVVADVRLSCGHADMFHWSTCLTRIIFPLLFYSLC